MNEEEVPEIWWPVTIGALLAAVLTSNETLPFRSTGKAN